MGWEKRGAGTYYYRKEREGDRVVSRYVGSGDVAEAIAGLEQIDRAQNTEKRTQEKQIRQTTKQKGEEIDAFCAGVEAILRQTLAAAGYHKHHRGEWRKRREERDRSRGEKSGIEKHSQSRQKSE